MPKQKRRGKGGAPIVIPKISSEQSGVERALPPEHPRPRKPYVTGGRRNLRTEFMVLLPALLLGALLYANTLHGQFVYDDKPQIARNTLIQDDSNLWRAMFSDVWAFKRGDAAAVSNYWRPSFVLWLIINFQMFGLDTFGWHLFNILLHLSVVALAFFLLRHLKVSLFVAGAIAALFAAHPAHTESVAWISGSPDLILSLALLGSMWFVSLLGKEKTALRWTLAIALYLIALGAKEIAIFYPLIVLVMLWRPEREYGEAGLPLSKALTIALPFVGLAALYFIVRQSILGQLAQWPEGGADLKSVILSAPRVFTFYLTQIVFPYWLSPSYQVRAVTFSNIGSGNSIIPLIVSLLALGGMLWLAFRSKLARIGLALFILPLIPAMLIGAFDPEQIVHDRYLYLPLLGFLIMIVPAVAALLERAKLTEANRRPWLILAIALALCVPLSAQTFRYNRAWLSNEALWLWGLRHDPDTSFNYVQYGAELYLQKRYAESAEAYDRSLQIREHNLGYLGRGTSLIELERFDEAERDLKTVIQKPTERVPSYTMYQAYEALAKCYEQWSASILKRDKGASAEAGKKLDAAANILAEGRNRLPQYRAALTEKLSIILYSGGQKKEAYTQLESVRAQARTETLPESRFVFYRIGLLAAELGQTGEARTALQEFLEQTKDMQDDEFKQKRSEAADALRRLPN
jgi:tetratricopeptide (TPR) repeat protein